MNRSPSLETLHAFKTALWKDQRHLNHLETNGQDCLVKHFTNTEETNREISIIQQISSLSKSARVPDIIDVDGTAIHYSYIRGIRIFNLFVEFDRLHPNLREKGILIKRRLLARCDINQREIQGILISLPKIPGSYHYPAGKKVGQIMRILANAVGIVLDEQQIDAELRTLDEKWEPMATVPFRDATIKNMVLAAPELWLGNFDSEKARKLYIVRTLEKDSLPAWTEAQIFDFDFSSCAELSTPEDDPISLHYHERTWAGPPKDPSQLVWTGTADGIRAALTFLVRYYRFGGRKAAYRLLHPWGHRIRFRHDNDLFYFLRLNGILKRLWPESCDELKSIFDFTDAVAHSLEGTRPSVDYFLATNFVEPRRYYVDMYPE